MQQCKYTGGRNCEDRYPEEFSFPARGRKFLRTGNFQPGNLFGIHPSTFETHKAPRP
jgi:hypothetical protein